MCGIFAYSSNSNDDKSYDYVFSGLKRLEYRGYDSWGIATLHKSKISVIKKVGKLPSKTTTSFKGHCGIGHTRWATHGSVTQNNAHPHYSSNKDFVVVHNGIVENYEELKSKLEHKGIDFTTETDTEVIVKLLEHEIAKKQDISSAVRDVHLLLEGRNTIVFLTNNGTIIGAKNGSPLVFGISKDNKDYYLSSDTYSFADKVDLVFVLENGQMLVIEKGKYEVVDMITRAPLSVKLENLDFRNKEVPLGKFKHYMEKEIADTPQSLLELTKIKNVKYGELATAIKEAGNVYIVGSGTAGNAAAQMAYYLREISGINAIALLGSDCSEFYNLFNGKDLVIALSQSGETADVIEVLEQAKKKEVRITSLVNMPGSMINRMSDIKFMANAGPEICVMSTKVFTSQISWGYIVARSVINSTEDAKKSIKTLALAIEKLLEDAKWISNIKKISKDFSTRKDIYILGKGEGTNIAKEGMVKIVEGAYIHAHAISSGELKHYAITLVESGVIVLSIVPANNLRKNVMNSVSQVKARGAVCIAISPENSSLFDGWISVPDLGELTSIASVIPLQLLSYYLSVYLDNDVDKPRNIAKSVTVK